MVKPHIDIRIDLGSGKSDESEKDWVKLWNCTSNIFSLLAQQGMSAEDITPLMLVGFARAMANQTKVPGEVAWLNVVADPKFKAGFLAGFDTQQEFARRVEEVRRAVEDDEPPAVRH
jgi:hypothetical protein